MELAMRAGIQRHSLVALLAGTFFVSGFSALLYQVAWQRLLGLFAGSDVYSVTIVIGAYLAGLGVGSLIGTVVADRLNSRRAIQLFGLCNLLIALFAFGSKLLFYDVLFVRWSALAASPAVLLVVSFLALLLPTTLMGLSLPLLSKALVRRMNEAARLISVLYAINTLGSATGSLIAGWYLIGTLGFDRAAYFGATLSAVVGAVALLIARSFRADDSEQLVQAVGVSRCGVPRTVWLWCGLVCASGFMAISLELVWFRLISVLVESKAYTFAHLLAFILLGYALGSAVGAQAIARIRDPRRAFLVVQGLVLLYTLGSILVVYLGFSAFAPALQAAKTQLDRGEGLLAAVWQLVPGYLVLPTLLLVPPNMLIGFTFPLVQKAVQTNGAAVGQRVGLVQVANIVGNTAGSILTGTLLLDRIGTVGTLRLLALLGVVFMLVLFWNAQRQPTQQVAVALLAPLVALIVLFPATNTFWARLHGFTTAQALVGEDSTGVSVLVEEANQATLYAGGASQGTIPFLPIHAHLGSLPALLHPNPQQVLAIGIGSAGTPYALGLNPRTERVTAVEIIGSELPVLRAYAARAGGQPLASFFGDKRFHIVVGDGRRELVQSQHGFDIIQADAIKPWKSHSGLLYSAEFFAAARAKLNPGGIMAQWVPTERTHATFMHVFPYGVNIDNTLLLGANEPVVYDKQVLLQRLADPQVQEHLRRGGIDPQQIAAFIEQQEATSWNPATPREGSINTDLLPKDEYYLNN
jgi:spermidine synthase